MRHGFLHIALSLLALLAGPSLSRAQSDITPLDPDFKRLPEIARRSGYLSCDQDWYEFYGMAVHVITPGSRDTRTRWIVTRQRCDTTITRGLYPDVPTELLMYWSSTGEIPVSQAYERVGPTDIGSRTSVLTSGDLDHDGYSDLVCAIRIIGDTSFGNRDYYISRVVVFWGQPNGLFSLSDTSQIPPIGRLWVGIPRDAVLVEASPDSSHLLIVGSLGDYAGNNSVVPAPPLRIFSLRHGERWGRNGVPCRAVWTMWKRPPVGIGNCVVPLDHDGDGHLDVVFYQSVASDDTAGWVSVLYGRPDALPDSNDMQTVYMAAARGRSSLLQDITGDGVPELIVHCGNDEVCRIYIGLRGRRLLEQYGSGADTARPGQPEWWGRPWATLRLPRAFWTGWGPSTRWVFDLGDGNGDGLADIWIVSSAYRLCYTTGEWLDEYADGIYDLVPGNVYNPADYPETCGYGWLGGPTRTEVKVLGITSDVRYLGISTVLPHADRHVHPLPAGTGKPTTAVPGERAWPWRMGLW